MPLTLAYTDADSALAKRIADQLTAVQTRGDAPVLIALISDASVGDADVIRQIDDAVQQDRAVIPVLVTQTPLPKSLLGLKPLDFTNGAYPFEALRRQVDELSLRPPTVRERNRRNGIVIGAVVTVIFLIGIYAVGVLGLHAPQDEFDGVETARVEQRNTLIAPTLGSLVPVGQFEISQFELTVTAAPTRLREYLVGTVTATSLGTFVPSLTPRPTQTPSQ